MASRPGHSYSNIHNADNSRNHYGDAYYQYGPSPDQQAFRAVLDSLRYDGMDDRLNRLNSAERGTFEWALTERKMNDEDSDVKRYICDPWSRPKNIGKAFTTWLVADDEDNGLVCFMGKPGSGKSTLMYQFLQTTLLVCFALTQMNRIGSIW
jgi:hypothetical protein